MGRSNYLAGPMSGIEGYNAPAFLTAASNLRQRGHTIVSPLELAMQLGPLGSRPYEDYIRNDLMGLLGCQAIILMNGWEGSRGARMELNVAHMLNMHVFHLTSEYDLRLSRKYGNQNVIE